MIGARPQPPSRPTPMEAYVAWRRAFPHFSSLPWSSDGNIPLLGRLDHVSIKPQRAAVCHACHASITPSSARSSADRSTRAGRPAGLHRVLSASRQGHPHYPLPITARIAARAFRDDPYQKRRLVKQLSFPLTWCARPTTPSRATLPLPATRPH